MAYLRSCLALLRNQAIPECGQDLAQGLEPRASEQGDDTARATDDSHGALLQHWIEVRSAPDSGRACPA